MKGRVFSQSFTVVPCINYYLGYPINVLTGAVLSGIITTSRAIPLSLTTSSLHDAYLVNNKPTHQSRSPITSSIRLCSPASVSRNSFRIRAVSSAPTASSRFPSEAIVDSNAAIYTTTQAAGVSKRQSAKQFGQFAQSISFNLILWGTWCMRSAIPTALV